MRSWSKDALVWEFVIEETRVNVLNFYLSKNGMILVDRQERSIERVLIHFFGSRVVKDYSEQCVLIDNIVC